MTNQWLINVQSARAASLANFTVSNYSDIATFICLDTVRSRQSFLRAAWLRRHFVHLASIQNDTFLDDNSTQGKNVGLREELLVRGKWTLSSGGKLQDRVVWLPCNDLDMKSYLLKTSSSLNRAIAVICPFYNTSTPPLTHTRYAFRSWLVQISLFWASDIP